jgi:hypothetical protein
VAKNFWKHGPEAERLTTGDIIAVVLCAGLGFIAAIVWMIQRKPKCMKIAGLSIVTAIVQMIFWYIVNMITWDIQHPRGGGF